MPSTPPATDPTVEHLRKTATPLRIAQFVAPQIWADDFRIDPWMLDAEGHIMSAFKDPEPRFLKINSVPQSGKSSLVEVWSPTWVLGHWPDTRIGIIAYSDILAQKSSELVRDIFQTWGEELFGLSVDSKADAKGSWRLAGHRGGIHAVGIGSSISGIPMDMIVIGDILRDFEEASSKTLKDKHWESYQGAIRARQAKLYLLGATRFADDDLSGRLDAQAAAPDYEGERWETLSYPALAEPDDDEEDVDENWRDRLGRVRGEPLRWRFSKPDEEKPENWHKSSLYTLKRSTESEIVWSALYQQNPTSAQGSMFPRELWGEYDPDEMPYMEAVCRSWDLATKDGRGDWTVGYKAGRGADGFYYVLDLYRKRKASIEVKTDVKMYAETDGVECHILIEQERSGSGHTVVDVYKSEMPLFQVHASIPQGSKHDRAYGYSMLQQAGKILLPKGADWVPDFIDEHRKMMADGRSPKHDDQIDTGSYAINHLRGSGSITMTLPEMAYHPASGQMVMVG